MKTQSLTATAADAALPFDWRRKLRLGFFFVIAWPLFNVMLIASIFLQFDLFSQAPWPGIIFVFFTSFALVYLIVTLLETRFPVALAEGKFWPQLFVHLALFSCILAFGNLNDNPPLQDEIPQVNVIPIVLLVFEITLYVAVKTFLVQREQHFNTQLTLRQARINLLRSQSNPHFLFNTLNLLASEISRNPETAREIVYDLADLLRESMKAADAEFISLREELRLSALYLGLQQKRFPDRLQFDIALEPGCELIQIPALLLQPIVENAVKHVVAHSTGVTHIGIDARMSNQELLISVKDNGPRVDHHAVQRGGGFRILGETLASHYPGTGRMTFTSSESGGEVAIHLPHPTGVHLVQA